MLMLAHKLMIDVKWMQRLKFVLIILVSLMLLKYKVANSSILGIKRNTTFVQQSMVSVLLPVLIH